MSYSTMLGDYNFPGNVVLKDPTLGTGCVANTNVASAAAIAQTKLEHQHRKTYAQANAAATAETKVLHLVHGATGEIVAFKVGSIVACTGDSTITVDLKVNGTSVLSAAVQLDNGNTAYVPEDAVISTADLEEDDVITIVVTVSAGTGSLGTGLFAELVVAEDAQ